MPLVDPIKLLEREDKWYLGNGGMLVYAPPFPKHLHIPGFWDECHFGDIAIEKLLCVSFVAEYAPTPESIEPGVGAALRASPEKSQAGMLAPPKSPGRAAVPSRDYEIAGRDARPPGSDRHPACQPIAQAGSRCLPLVELEAHTSHWHWYPDRIEIRHYLVERDGIGFKQQRGVRIFLNETRRIGPDSTLYCDLSFEVLKGCEVNNLHVVAWTAHKNTKDGGASGFTDLHGYGERLGYSLKARRREHKRGDKALKLDVTMGGNIAHTSLQVTPSHGAELTPRLMHTPLWDNLKRGKLSGEIVGENVLGSVVYAGMHWKLPVVVDEIEPLSLTVKTNNPADGSRPGAAHGQQGGYYQSLSTPDPSEAWREFIALVPHFECSDPLLTRYYWYRWYGLRLNALPPGGNYDHPAVTEGISYFRGVITYSLMCHLNECKWLSDPSLALGCLRAHVKHQTKSGHFPGHIYLSHVNKKGFYHTDIGRSLTDLAAHHPDIEIAKEFIKPLQRLLRFYLTERDREGLDLFDVRDQFETGQEFTSRYFHGDDKADLHGWDHKLRLKGVDVTTYVYHLAVLLKEFGISTGDVKLVRECAELAERIKGAVRSFMWDSERAMFVDYHAKTKEKSPYLAAVGFWPLLSDLATDEQALAAGLHLLPANAGGTGLFDAPYPTPTVPTTDEYFSADPRWRGERANCPWNGRVWPMVNSHIADVMGRLCKLEPARYRPQLAAYIQRYIAMMHFEMASPVGQASVLAIGRAAVPGRGLESAGTEARPTRIMGGTGGPPVSSGGYSAPSLQNQSVGKDAAATGTGDAGLAPTKDFSRPNCFEHYHPNDGTACEYRGIDDYQHSWVADLILKYVAGVRVEGGRLVVDPMPFKLDWFLLKGCHVAGRKLDLCWNRDLKGKETSGFKVYIDGSLAHEAKMSQKFVCEL